MMKSRMTVNCKNARIATTVFWYVVIGSLPGSADAPGAEGGPTADAFSTLIDAPSFQMGDGRYAAERE
jgi:hypothetical protein